MLSVMQLADIFCSAFVREKMGQILTNQEKYIEQTSQPRKTMDNIRDTKWVVESIMWSCNQYAMKQNVEHNSNKQ